MNKVKKYLIRLAEEQAMAELSEEEKLYAKELAYNYMEQQRAKEAAKKKGKKSKKK